MSLIYSPGPAAYDVHVTINNNHHHQQHHNNNNSSSNKKQQEMLEKMRSEREGPGPGAYDPSLPVSSPRFSMSGTHSVSSSSIVSSSASSASSASSVPGPGAYSPPLPLHHRQEHAKTMSARLNVNDRSEIPGPGAYSISLPSDGPHYSMRSHPSRSSPSSSRLKKDKNGVPIVTQSHEYVPGPGAYSPIISPNVSGGVSLKSRHLPKSETDVPGPGAYAPNLSHKESPPAYTLRPRLSSQHESVGPDPGPGPGPGPGAYDADQAHGFGKDAPAKTMASKWWDAQGGGAAGGKETERRRKRAELGEGPGPGAYKEPSYIGEGHAPSFTMLGRHSLSLPSHSSSSQPGPGSHSVSLASSSRFHAAPSHSIGRRHPLNEYTEAPGPGAYDVGREENMQTLSTYTTSPSYTMRARTSGSAVTGGKRDSTKTAAAADDVTTEPGPGAYTLPSTLINSNKHNNAITMKSRHVVNDDNHVPGPGAYGGVSAIHAVGQDAPAFSFRAKLNNNFANNNNKNNMNNKTSEIGMTPGPGAYTSPIAIGQGPKKTMSGRVNEPHSEAVPGPGSYNPPAIGDAPSYSMRPRLIGDAPSASSLVPGPGAYSPSFSLSSPTSPSLSLSPHLPPPSSHHTPGPQHYDLLHAQHTTIANNEAPKYSMAPAAAKRKTRHEEEEERRKEKKEEIPGPGHYEVNLPKGRAVTLSGRHPLSDDNHVPGPGSYSVSHDFESSKGAAPKHTMAPKHGLASLYASSTNPGHHIL